MKDSNPKAAFAANKLPLHLVPPSAIAYASIGLLEGALKYGRSNWREDCVSASTYYDACLRHMMEWMEGKDLSPEGVPHLANAIACLCILIDATEHGKLIDDRNYQGEQHEENMKRLSEFVPFLREQFVHMNPTQYDKRKEDENGNF